MSKSIKSLKFTYIVVTLVVVIIAVLVRTYFSDQELKQVLAKKMEALAIKTERRFQEDIQSLHEAFILLTKSYEKNPLIMKSILEDNRSALHKQIKDDYELLKTYNRYLHPMHFIDSKNITILRMHKPHSFDDDLTHIRPIVKYVNETQKIQTGFEPGKNGITYRITIPLSWKGKHIGVLEYGIKPAFLADALFKESLDVQAQILVKTQMLRHIVNKKPWERVGDYSIIEASPLFKQVKSELDISQHRQFINAIGRNFMVLNELNLKSFKGEVLAKVVIAQDITGFIKEHQQKLYKTYLFDIVLLLFISLIVFILFHQYTVKIQSLQDKLIESEKMASLGKLVAGVAHEINTPLGNALTVATLFEKEFKKVNDEFNNQELTKHVLEDFFKTIHDADEILMENLKKVTALVTSFKKISIKLTKDKLISFDLHLYIERVLSSFKMKFEDREIDVVLDFFHEDIIMQSYVDIFYEVFVTLLENTLLHAYDKGENGSVTISTRSDGERVIITFSDEGKGVDSDMKDYIFDPFTTTKRNYGGIGLGLHIIYNLISQHLKGSIRLDKEYTNGSRFIIDVPLKVS